MTKLKSTVSYGCLTKIKPLAIFYLVEYSLFALTIAIVALITGKFESGSSGAEFASAVFVGVTGILGFKEDFKAYLQNGFTRKHIFVSTFCTFFLVSGCMALIDTLIGNTLHRLLTYITFFGTLYGYGQPIFNRLWLTALYATFCSIFYLIALVLNKVGKMVSLLIGVGFAGVVLLVIALFRFVFSQRLIGKIATFVMRAFGFMADGTVNLIFPILTFLTVCSFFALASYALIRGTELK